MKRNLFEKRGHWDFPNASVFSLTLLFLIGLAAKNSEATVVVDVPAAQHYFQNNSPFKINPFGPNSLLGNGIGSTFKMPNLSASCSRDIKRFFEQIIPGGNETEENWALQSM